MTTYGYTLMTEQSGPKEIVRYAAAAERAGFDFEVMSDHYSPWLAAQGHAAYAWSMLGAVTQVTDRVELMTYVTSPIMRYHPAVVAQKAATVALLSDGRFILGLGAGENLNEHVVGRGWPPVNVRHEMFGEAIEIISQLLDGGYVNYAGDHFRVDSAKVWDLPEAKVPIGAAVSGDQSIARFAPLVDHLISTEPEAELVQTWDAATEGRASRKIGQIPICWDRDRGRRRGAGPRAVPLVRRRLEGQRGAARAVGLRGRHPVRPPRGRRRLHPVRTRRARASWRPSATSPEPGTPTSRSCRSATRTRRSSWSSPRATCCRRCARPGRTPPPASGPAGPRPTAPRCRRPRPAA